ncbi:helix-turn-helix domain-containing protein [Sedimenticola sp.]|uniref:helix-turn-helix domain-containing protein n=1 Tax=Sedimenticola sp. TaxID=1940285 RepID=UPI003D12257A
MPSHAEPDSLRHLGFRMYAPSPTLASVVQCYWQVRCALKGEEAAVEYLYAKGGMGMVFNFADTPHFDGSPMSAPALFDGTNSGAKRFSATGTVHILGVRFHPGGAYPVTGIPLHELAHAPLALDELALDVGGNLYAKLCDCQATEQRIGLLEQWLWGRIEARQGLHATTREALGQLQAQQGRIEIGTLCDQLAIGRRRLERRFKREIGISPKYYARLLRVEQARQLLKQPVLSNLADVGYGAGFYDQSHFNHEFKTLVGLTPHAYRERKRLATAAPFQAAAN